MKSICIQIHIILIIQLLSNVKSYAFKECRSVEEANKIVFPILRHLCKTRYIELEKMELNLTQILEIYEKAKAKEFERPKLQRQRRQTTEENINPLTIIFVDSIVNTIKPNLGAQGFLLDALKPFLVSVATGFVKEFVKFVKGVLDQGPFIDVKAFEENKYEAYPVFIPSYGAFVLLSKSGTLDMMKENMKNNEFKDINSCTNNNCTDSVEKSNNITILSENQLVSDSKESTEKSTTGKALENKSNDNELRNFSIGEAHLIPINSKASSFESSRQVEDAYKNEDGNGPAKEYIKQIVDARLNIKSFKKRLLLSLLKKMEKAIKSL